EQELTVVLSSHLLTDLERVCDWLVVLSAGRGGGLAPGAGLLARPPAWGRPARSRSCSRATSRRATRDGLAGPSRSWSSPTSAIRRWGGDLAGMAAAPPAGAGRGGGGGGGGGAVGGPRARR